MSLLRACVCLGILALVATLVPADDKSHRKAAEELIDLLQYDKALAQSIDSAVDVYTKQYPDYKAHRNALKRTLARMYDLKSIREEIIKFVVREFTEEELQELNRFYKTPVGKKLIEKNPEMIRMCYEIGAKRMLGKEEEFSKIFAEEVNKGDPS